MSGWSKAEDVSGVQDIHYSLYADIEYEDGTVAYGFNAPFSVGTHDWEHRCGVIAADKPMRTVRYAAFCLISVFMNLGCMLSSAIAIQERSGLMI